LRSSTPLPSHHLSPPTTFTLSLHDALPIFSTCLTASRPNQLAVNRINIIVPSILGSIKVLKRNLHPIVGPFDRTGECKVTNHRLDRKSTRLNSSHVSISYAVFCLQKKKRQR